ncbi:MAG: GFA family protein [Myxococcota bacterium]|nr:GFA family protein [Myxococcota bacterium]
MIRGACLCGGVRYEARGVAFMSICHCSMCRKSTGASFSVFANVKPENFEYVAGRSLVERYESSPGNFRGFCRECGSSVPVVVEGRPGVMIPAGTIEGDPRVRPAFHIMVGSKASWVEIGDALPQFDAFVPGFETAHLDGQGDAD